MKFPMTPHGYRKMKDELRECQAERPKIADIILEAREHGDLSENADYHAAKEKQGFLEARIIELEAKIGQAEVIDPAKLRGTRVVFGATVDLEDPDTGEATRYTIVGDDEADLKKRRISISSPVARALIGHEEGEEVQVKAPGGIRVYEIVGVSFIEVS